MSKERRYVRALYDWDAEEAGDLSIQCGDIIEVKLEDDGWALGTLEGREGQFPVNYTEPYNRPAVPAPPPVPTRKRDSLVSLPKVSDKDEDDSKNQENVDSKWGKSLNQTEDGPPPLPAAISMSNESLNIPEKEIKEFGGLGDPPPPPDDDGPLSICSGGDEDPPPPPSAPSPRSPATAGTLAPATPHLRNKKPLIANETELEMDPQSRTKQQDQPSMNIDVSGPSDPEVKVSASLQSSQENPTVSHTNRSSHHGRRRKKQSRPPMPVRCRGDDDRFKELWKAVQSMRMSIKCKDRRSGLKVYKQCFLGAEVVDWMIAKRMSNNREEGVEIGNEIINNGMITHVTGTENFNDSRSCYVFCDTPLYGQMRIPGNEAKRKEACLGGGLIFSSMVLKLGGAFKNKMQQRYMEFERNGDSYVLKYYNNIRKDPKGVITLTGDCVCELDPKKKRSFHLVTMERHFEFQTLTEEHCKIWTECLQFCIKIRMERFTELALNAMPLKEREKTKKFLDIIELGEHKHKKTGQHIHRCFRGKEAVDAMRHHGLAETPHQAIVFGNLLIEHRVIKSWCNEHPFENKKHLYLLFFPETSSKEEQALMSAQKSSRRTKSFVLPKDFLQTGMTRRLTVKGGDVDPTTSRGELTAAASKTNLLSVHSIQVDSPDFNQMNNTLISVDSPMRKDEDLTYRNTIPHCLETIFEQNRKQLLLSKALNTQLSTLVKTDLKLCDLQLKAARTLKTTDTSMVGIVGLIDLAQQSTSDHWHKHSMMLKKIEDQVLRPWKDKLDEFMLRLKTVEKKYKKSKEKREEMVTKLENTFKCCNQLIHKMKKRLAKSMGDQKSGAEKKRWGGLFAARNKGEGKKEELAKQLAELSQKYHDQLATVNSAVDQYESECGKVAQQVEELERKHLTCTKDSLNKWASISMAVSNANVSRFEAIMRKVSDYSENQDVREYITKMRRKHGKKPRPERFNYDLPYTLKEIKEGNLEKKNASVFDATLEQVMTLQQNADNVDVASLNVPAIVLVLISAIERNGGFKAEGIFRISAAKKDLDRLKKQIDGGNYEVNEKSPHVAAGLLKLWIRHLAEPLIPSALYYDALKMAKKPEITEEDIIEFVATIPDLNKGVICHLSSMARDIVKLEDQNRMNMNNLAIVFAPGMLQDPGDDPQAMLANSKYEIRFTVELLTHFPLTEA